MTISTIDPSTPGNDEPAGDGDNQLRALKQAIVDQFAGEAGDLWDTALTVGPRALNAIESKADQADLDALDARVSTNELAISSQADTFVGHDSRLDALETDSHTLTQAKSAAWPVGSVFISADGGTPTSKGLPGSWTRIGDGRFLMGASSGFGGTGGASTVTLQKGNIPAHQHKHVIPQDESGTHPSSMPSYSGYTSGSVGTDGDSLRFKEVTTDNGVSDGLKSAPNAVNIQNKFLKVAFYQRTA